MKAVEAALASRIMGKLYPGTGYPYYGYGYPLIHPIISKESAEAIGAINAIHGAILRYEYDNAIAGLVKPSVDAVSKILEAITNEKGMAGKAGDKKEDKKDAPESKTFLQTEGVPVTVNPTLMPNEMKDADLGQRNWVIEGVNGYDLVQTKEQGVPVFPIKMCQQFDEGVTRSTLVGSDTWVEWRVPDTPDRDGEV